MRTNDAYTEQLQQTAEEFQQMLQKSGILSQDTLTDLDSRLKKEVYELLQSPKPKVMVYGIYNSGKSTLVNALCRQAVAEVADHPMTCRVQEYDAGKYILIDSPGVDAPMEHEKIADSQLSKCHMILFVISSKGSFEHITNYEKMVKLIKLKIPFYIILNDRGVALPKDDKEKQLEIKARHQSELNEIKRKIILNLRKISGDQSITDQYQVIDVNAKRAWMGIEKGNPKLLEASGVETLRLRIEQVLEESGGLKWIQAPLSALDNCIGEAESQVMSLQGNDKYANQRREFDAMLEGMRSALYYGVQDRVYSRREELYRCILAGRDESAIVDEVVRDVEDLCRCEDKKMWDFIDKQFPGMFPAEGGQDPYGFRRDYTAEPVKGRGHGKQGEGNVIHIHPPAGDAAPLPLLMRIKEMLKSKKKKEKELYERMLQDAEINNKAVAARVEEEIRRRQDSRTAAVALLDELKRDIRRVIDSTLQDRFEPVRGKLDQENRKRQQMSSRAGQLLEQLRVLRNRLENIRRQDS